MNRVLLTGKIIIAVLIIVLMRFFVVAYAVEDTWVYIDGKENKLWSLDTDSIACQDYICRALIKLPSVEKDEYATNLYEYNCMGMQHRILQTTKYDSRGNVLSRFTPPRPEWMNTIPESINGELRSFVCKKATLQQKQHDINKEDNRAGLDKKQILKEGVTESGIRTIQVGAFTNFSYAETLAKRLYEKGYKAYIAYPGSEDKTLFYRVCVGQFTTKKEAKILSERIRKAEDLETFITVR